MLKVVTVAVLAAGLWGCGGDEAERQELLNYVQTLQKMDGMNREVVRQIEMLDDPSIEITAADLEKARQLIADYVAEMEKIDPLEMSYRPLRLAYTNHLKKLKQAIELARDKGRELRRERGNVAIGMRHIEKMSKLHFKAIDVLWLRQDIADPYPLEWPQ